MSITSSVLPAVGEYCGEGWDRDDPAFEIYESRRSDEGRSAKTYEGGWSTGVGMMTIVIGDDSSLRECLGGFQVTG